MDAERKFSLEADELLKLRLFGKAQKAPNAILDVKRGDRPVLSSHQRRLWFLHHLFPEAPAYNILISYRFRGKLNEGVLERALAFILDRHEVLRTHFPVVNGEPFQQIDPAGAFRLFKTDASSMQNGEKYAISIVRSMRDTRFDLQQGPLFCVKFIKLSSTEYVLCIVVHHSIFDRDSLEIFCHELATAYADISEGAWPKMNPLPVQYADYATWEHRVLCGDEAADHLTFWEEHLAGASFQLDLPTDRPRPTAPSWHAGSVEISIPPETADRLRNVATDRGATIFMLCLAAYHVILSRYAGADDTVVGIPVNQRSNTALERMIGFFANSLPIHLKISNDMHFSDLVDHAKYAVLDAYEHSIIPFDHIVDRIGPSREASRNPIMQVWFDLANSVKRTDGQVLRLPELETSNFDNGTVHTRFDFEMHLVRHQSGALHGQLLYADELFDQGTAKRFARHYENFLAAAAANPEQHIWKIPIFDADESSMIIDGWGASSGDDAEGIS